MHFVENYELIEAQNQIEFLREHLNDTKGKIRQTAFVEIEKTVALLSSERLVSMEDTHRLEEDRYRSLTTDYNSLRDELVELKQRAISEKNDQTQLIDDQQNQLEQLAKSIVSKQSEHEQLLSVYLCFFLSSYLLIFFLFFCLLSW